MGRTAYVIDIGTSKTTCVAATVDHDDLKVVSAAAVVSRGVKKGRVAEPELVAECLRIAIGRVKDETGKTVDRVLVGVPGRTVRSELSRGVRPMYPAGKEVHQEDLLQVNEHSRQFRLQDGFELLQTLPCDYRIDGLPVVGDPIGKRANRLEVITHVMSAQAKDLERLGKTVKAAGVEIEEFVPVSLATGLGAIRPVDAEAGCLVVDIGSGTTDAAVFERGSCSLLASIEVNGAHVTGDIANLIKVSTQDAESLKLAHGHADPSQIGEDEVVHVKQVGNEASRPFPRKVLSEIIESRVREIATLLKEELLKPDPRRQLPRSIVLTGGGAHLPGTDAVFKRVFDADSVRLGTPRLVGTESRRVSVPEMSAAVGLALFALEGSEVELAPVSGAVDWKQKIRSLRSIFGPRS